MLIQIIRTLIVGAIIYFISKLIKQAIDRKLDAPDKHESVNPPSHPDKENPKLVPCAQCGVYFHATYDNQSCGREDCPYGQKH